MECVRKDHSRAGAAVSDLPDGSELLLLSYHLRWRGPWARKEKSAGPRRRHPRGDSPTGSAILVMLGWEYTSRGEELRFREKLKA
jgi:hypothetical protein